MPAPHDRWLTRFVSWLVGIPFILARPGACAAPRTGLEVLGLACDRWPLAREPAPDAGSGALSAVCHNYFAKLGHPVPENFNPADHLLDVISIDYRNDEAKQATTKRVDAIVTGWRGGVALADDAGGEPDLCGLELAGGGAGCCTAFPLLLARTWRELTRNKAELAIQARMRPPAAGPRPAAISQLTACWPQIGMNLFFSSLFGIM